MFAIKIPGGAVIPLLAAMLVFTVLGLGITDAAGGQPDAEITIFIRGYDNLTAVKASLVDYNYRFLENKTVFSSPFSFERVAVNQTYLVLLEYKGIEYYEQITVTEPRERLTIPVFELTESDEDIIISFHHLIIQHGDNGVNVTEALEFVNSGPRVFNGSQLKVSMPPTYANFESGHACCLSRTDYGLDFRPPAPLKPNETQILTLSYVIPTASSRHTLSLESFYPTDMTLVIVEKGKVKVESYEGLISEGEVELEDGKFDLYSQTSVPRGDRLVLVIGGLPAGTLQWLWAGTGFIVAGVAGAVLYGLKGRRRSSEKLQAEKEALQTVLEQLEKDFGEDRVREVEYLKLKAKFKEKLERVEKRLKEFPRRDEG